MMKRQTSRWAARTMPWGPWGPWAAALLSLAVLFAAPEARAAAREDTNLLISGDACVSVLHEAPAADVGLATERENGLDAGRETRAASEPAYVKREGEATGDADKKTDEDKKGDDDGDAGKAAADAQDGGGGEFRRWGFSLHGGVSIPHPDFSDSHGVGPNFGVDLEFRFNKYFSLEGIYTFHRFSGERIGPFGPGNVFIEFDDLNLHQFSVNGKVYAAGGNSPFRPFFNAGGGVYVFDPGDTRGGINVGGGIQFDVTEKMAVEGGYNFHAVFGIFDEAKFSTVQFGVRFRF